MVTRYRRDGTGIARIGDDGIRLRFTGGLNATASPTDISVNECCLGKNFKLHFGDASFRTRTGTLKIAQAPNNKAITGFATLEDTTGTVFLALQATDTIYKWDGTNFTNVATCNANAKLRGPSSAIWPLSNSFTFVTDLALIEPVKFWDGTNFADANFTKNNGANAYGTFKSKYCVVTGERALFGNVVDSIGNNYHHLLVGSTIGNGLNISTTDRASDAIGDADPWFLPTTDLHPIAGLVYSFGQLVIATLHGRFNILTGDKPSNFAIQQLYTGVGLTGDEAIVASGNDIIYAADGRITSLGGVIQYGNVLATNLGIYISPLIEQYAKWRVAYNQRRFMLYCFPDTINTCFASNLSVAAMGTDSPWMEWKTTVDHDFQPELIFTAKHPGTKLEETFITDSSGGLYLLESDDVYEDSMADGSTTGIEFSRASKLFVTNLDQTFYYVDGYLEYVPQAADTLSVSIRLEGADATISAQQLDLSLGAVLAYWNNAVEDTYFGDDCYYGDNRTTRLIRQTFDAAGQSDMLSIEISGVTNDAVKINAVGIRCETVD